MSRDVDLPAADNPDWAYGVALGALLWVAGSALAAADAGVPTDIVGTALLVGWFVLPVSLYFDARYVAANGDWEPIGVLWAVGGLLPLANVLVAGVYLDRRRRSVGLPVLS